MFSWIYWFFSNKKFVADEEISYSLHLATLTERVQICHKIIEMSSCFLHFVGVSCCHALESHIILRPAFLRFRCTNHFRATSNITKFPEEVKLTYHSHRSYFVQRQEWFRGMFLCHLLPDARKTYNILLPSKRNRQ